MNYTTLFENNTMVIIFSDEYKVITDFSLKMAYMMKDNIVKTKFSIDEMSLDEFHQILLNFEKSISL